MWKTRCLLVILLMAILSVVIIPAHAQEQITLSVALPEFLVDILGDTIVQEWEAVNPNVRLHLVGAGNNFGIPGVSLDQDVEDYLDDMESYVSAADVLLVDSSLSPEATRAGYFLDLSPLVDSDPSLDSADFYTSLWESFQWDGGIWALPVSATASFLFYDPAAFDEAGLTYPDSSWTVADLDNAIRTLTQYDAQGDIVMPGILNFGTGSGSLLMSLLGDTLVDESVLPNTPRFDNPNLEALVNTWAQLNADGLLDLPSGVELNLQSAPLYIGSSLFLAGPGDDESEVVPVAFPGGKSPLDVTAFGISSGSQYPEQAYEFIKFLTTNPDVANSFFGGTPARRSLQGVEAENTGGLVFGGIASPQMQELTSQALESGISVADMRFSESLEDVINRMDSDGLDAHTALQEIEAEINDRLQVATDRRDDTQIIVAAPPEERVAAPDEITLNFGIASNIRPFPFDDQWQAAIDDFVASDPEVGIVQFDTPLGGDLETLAGEYDCFYMPNNPISDADLSLLLNLDPLLSSDPSFDPDDMVGNVMALARRNGMTWGLPMAINPLAMRYNIDVFNQAGVTPPVNGWTIEQFVDALRVIDATQSENKVPFVSRAFGNSHLFMLIAAYGGLPFDYGVDPVGVNFTDPATVDAIRQALDLAKDGYIQYNGLTTGGNFSVVIGSADETSEPDAIYTEILSGFGFGGGGGFVIIQGGGAEVSQQIGGSAGSNPNLLTTFPTGRTYSPVSYDLGMTLISANTQFAEACYRFMRHISNNTELFTAMPVSRSLLNSPEYQNSQSPDAIAFYKTFDQILQQPNVIEILAFGGGDPTGVLRDYWLNRAFDRYVLEGADLEVELAEAELFTNAYQECVADIPPFDPSPGQNQIGFFQQFSDCATQVDPTASSFFGR